MMAGAFLYLPEKYQSKGVHKRLLTDVAVLMDSTGGKTTVVGMGRMASTGLL